MFYADFSQTCTSGFLSPTRFNGSTSTQQIVPLFGLFQNTFSFSEQWIFPDLRINCHGTVDRWIFNGQGSLGSSCVTRLTTWRRGRFAAGTVDVYDRVSATDANRARIIRQNGSISTYELVTPGIRVIPGDFLGIEIDCFSTFFGDVVTKLNVLGIRDDSRSVPSRSYRRTGSGTATTIFASATRFEQNFFPLVEAVMGKVTIKIYMEQIFIIHYLIY